MSIPSVNITIKDKGLGLLPNVGTGIFAKIGPSSAGTVNTVYSGTTYDTVHSQVGYGPMPDAASLALGSPTNGVTPAEVLLVRANASTPGAAGSVTYTRANSSTGTIATTGSAPVDAYSVVLKVTTTGTLGTAQFTYSLDGGTLTSPPIIVPSGGTYVIPNVGITLVFTPGAGPTFFEVGDSATFSTTAPACSTGDYGAAIDALIASPLPWEAIHIVGVPADTTALAALYDAIAAKLNTAESKKVFVSAMIESPDVSDSTLEGALTGKSHLRMLVAGGFEHVVIPDSLLTLKRSAAWGITARAAAVPVSTDVAFVGDGPLANVDQVGGTDGTRDENATPGLDDARYSSLRTWTGQAGTFVTNARIFGPLDSDFRYWQHRRVMDLACRVAYAALIQFSSDKFRANPPSASFVAGSVLKPGDPGTILEQDARRIETAVLAKLRVALTQPGHVSAVAFVVDRASPILTTQTLGWAITIEPLGYAKTISGTIQFVNPAA